MNQCPRCLKNTGTANGDIHTCSPTDWARKMEARIAELEEALSLAPCECDQLRGFDKCYKCEALNK